MAVSKNKVSREDYLLTIYRQCQEHGFATNKDICMYLNLAKGSVSEMVSKLKNDEIIEINSNQITLSEKGIKWAEELLSVHRLWETFLINHLSIPIDQVHEMADALEHVTNPDLKDALNQFLNYPELDPMGKPIFINKK